MSDEPARGPAGGALVRVCDGPWAARGAAAAAPPGARLPVTPPGAEERACESTDRLATPRELAGLMNLFEQVHGPRPRAPGWLRRKWVREQLDRRSSWLACDRDGAVVGYLLVAAPERGGARWTAGLGVVPRARGRGFARALLDAALADPALGSGMRWHAWVDDAGVRAFEAAGFRAHREVHTAIAAPPPGQRALQPLRPRSAALPWTPAGFGLWPTRSHDPPHAPTHAAEAPRVGTRAAELRGGHRAIAQWRAGCWEGTPLADRWSLSSPWPRAASASASASAGAVALVSREGSAALVHRAIVPNAAPAEGALALLEQLQRVHVGPSLWIDADPDALQLDRRGSPWATAQRAWWMTCR